MQYSRSASRIDFLRFEAPSLPLGRGASSYSRALLQNAFTLPPRPPARPNGPDNHHGLRNCPHVAVLTSVWKELFGNAHAFRQVSRKPEHFTAPGSMGAPN